MIPRDHLRHSGPQVPPVPKDGVSARLELGRGMAEMSKSRLESIDDPLDAIPGYGTGCACGRVLVMGVSCQATTGNFGAGARSKPTGISVTN